MAQVAFLGTGLLGSGMVEALCGRGDAVTVWNRTDSKARALERAGARVAASPAEAVAGAERVHMTLSDDAAVDAVLTSLLPGLSPGAVVLDHTTTSPSGTIARYARLRERGVRFLHAPVFMSPDMARQSKGLLMTSGPEAVYDAVREPLGRMASEAWHLGDDPGRAAAFKLFGNSMLFVLSAGLVDVFAMARGLGLSATEAMAVFAKFPLGAAVVARGTKMASADFTATFELTMARKDMRLMLEAAGTEPLGILPAIARRMDDAIAAGYGHEDMGALTRLGR